MSKYKVSSSTGSVGDLIKKLNETTTANMRGMSKTFLRTQTVETLQSATHFTPTKVSVRDGMERM